MKSFLTALASDLIELIGISAFVSLIIFLGIALGGGR